MINKNSIIDAYVHIRKNDCTIPDDVLDFMKDAAINKLEAIDKAKSVIDDAIISVGISNIRALTVVAYRGERMTFEKYREQMRKDLWGAMGLPERMLGGDRTVGDSAINKEQK